MPIVLESERVLSLAAAARSLPRLNGKKVHTASVWRWCRKGCRGVQLEYARLGGRMVTSVEALTRFANRLAELDPKPEGNGHERHRPVALLRPPRGRTERQRQRDIERAEAELRAAGVLK